MDWLQRYVFYSGLGLRSGQQFIIFTQNITLAFLLNFRFAISVSFDYEINLPH